MSYMYIVLSLILLICAPFFGQIDINPMQINDINSIDYKLFWELRVPRIIVAFFTGAMLGISGLIFQSLFRNPMSTPFTLGVASGATLGTAFAIVFGLLSLVAFFGFLGALLTIVILFGITSKTKSYETSTLLLVGIALSFFYSAALMILFYVSDQRQSYEIVRFTMGSLDVIGMTHTLSIVIASSLLLIIVLRYKKEIKLLLTSYDNAFLKGIEVKRVNIVLLMSVSVAVGVAVSITGPIGFVGLIVPHILKIINKKSADRLLVPTFFYGGIFLVLCDFISRNIGTASDIPIGVVTSFIGAPFFIYLLVRRKKT